jgi:hypothetical protein
LAFGLAAVVWLTSVVGCSRLHTREEKSAIITVGHEKADVIGDDNTAIQKAIDRVAAVGGGTVRIKAGTYTLWNSVRLASHVTVAGEGTAKTILEKCEHVESRVTNDADGTESEAAVEDPRGFRLGMGVTVYDNNPWQGLHPNVKTLVRLEGSTLFFDDIFGLDYAVARSAMATDAFPLIAGYDVEDVHLHDLTADGKRTGKEPKAESDGVAPAAIYFYHAKNFSIRGVVARNVAGDGVSTQYVEAPVIEDCEAYGNAAEGIHLGTRALRAIVRRNRSHDNHYEGLYLCWEVQHGTFEDNECRGNDRSGISIGHKDTDNVFIKNLVRDNGKAGVYFRDDPEITAGHRNTFRENVIEDNGRRGAPGYGIRIDGATQHITLVSNIIGETRQGPRATQQVGVYIGPRAAYITCERNTFSGDMKRKIVDKSKRGHDRL